MIAGEGVAGEKKSGVAGEKIEGRYQGSVVRTCVFA